MTSRFFKQRPLLGTTVILPDQRRGTVSSYPQDRADEDRITVTLEDGHHIPWIHYNTLLSVGEEYQVVLTFHLDNCSSPEEARQVTRQFMPPGIPMEFLNVVRLCTRKGVIQMNEHDSAGCLTCDALGDFATTDDTELWLRQHEESGYSLTIEDSKAYEN